MLCACCAALAHRGHPPRGPRTRPRRFADGYRLTHARHRHTTGPGTTLNEPSGTTPEQIEDLTARFASVASHDLRNGLATLRGFLDLVVEEEQGLGELSSHLLQRAFEVTDRMGRLVDAIGEYGRARRRTLDLQPIAVQDAVQAVLRRLKGPLQDVAATVEVEPLPEVVADEEALQDIIDRLLDNSLRYRAPDHAPRVRITGGADGDTAWFAIEDDGPGLPPGTEEDVFEPFSKTLNSRGHNTPGLGLATASALVERCGGRIRAETVDADAGGTRVTIELPAA